jgi:hypothetical protein
MNQVDHSAAVETGYPRAWRWDEDGLVVEGRYVRLDEGITDYGPVPIVVLDVEGEQRSLWLSATALRSRFADELRRRGDSDFERGERIRIERAREKKVSSTGRSYWPFAVAFLDSVPRTAAEILAVQDPPEGEEDVPF